LPDEPVDLTATMATTSNNKIVQTI